MIPLLHDLLAARPTALSRLDARVVAVLGAALLLACVAAPSWPLPAAVAAAMLVTAWRLGLPLALVAARMAAPLLVVAVLVAVQVVLGGRQGLDHAALIACRVLGASAVTILIGSTVPVHRLAGALRWLRVPGFAVELLLLVYRFTFVLIDRVESGADALRLRLGWTDRRRRLQSAGLLAGLVLLRSLDQAGRTAEAMRLRGGPGRLPLAPLPPLAGRDRLAMGAGVLAVAALWWSAGALP